jgi:hypothetical protein
MVESQLNVSALWIIQQAVGDKEMPHIEDIFTAKEAWEVLADTFIGNKNMKCNKFDEVSNEADGFLMEDGEDHKDMYRRLKALAKRFKKLGAEHADDAWVKRKYIQSLMDLEANNLKIIKNKHNYHSMTSNEVMQEIEASTVGTKNALASRNRALGDRKGGNLALKAKVMEREEGEEDDESTSIEWSADDIKYDLNEYLALTAKHFGRTQLDSNPVGTRRVTQMEAIPMVQGQGCATIVAIKIIS